MAHDERIDRPGESREVTVVGDPRRESELEALAVQVESGAPGTLETPLTAPVLDERRKRAWSSTNAGNVAARSELLGTFLRVADHELKANGRILDVGCGVGWWLRRLHESGVAGPRLFGVDASPERVALGQRHLPEGAQLLMTDARALPFPDGHFELVMLFSLLSCLRADSDRAAAIAEARRVLAPGGLLVAYDVRLAKPTGEATFRLTRRSARRALGPGVASRSITVLPPVARHLGRATETAYPALARAPFLRGHRLAVVRNQAPARRTRRKPIAAETTRVAMLVRNSAQHDTRVRKEARALTDVGYHVVVIATQAPTLPDDEMQNGVRYLRIATPATTLLRWRARYLSVQDRRRRKLRANMDRVTARRAKLTARHTAKRARIVEQRNRLLARLKRSRLPAPAKSRIKTGLVRFTKWRLELTRRFTLRRYAANKNGRERAKRRFKRVDGVLKWMWNTYRSAYKASIAIHYHRDYDSAVRATLARLDPHIVHAHDLNTLWAGWRHSRRHHVRLVYDAHELELHRNTVWTPFRRVVARVVESIGARGADRSITVSPDIAHAIARTYRIRTPAVVLNSPSAAPRSAVAVQLKELAALDPQATLAVYVGKVGFGRGLEQLIASLSFLPPDVHVGILGPRDRAEDDEMIKLANAQRVRDRLHLFAPLPPEQVPASVGTADLAVVPIQNVCRSYDLAMPNKLFDALMAGIPLAVSRLQSMEDFVTQHELGVVFDEEDPRALAAAMLELREQIPAGIADRERLTKLQVEHSWERQATVLSDLYAEMTRQDATATATSGLAGSAASSRA